MSHENAFDLHVILFRSATSAMFNKQNDNNNDKNQ